MTAACGTRPIKRRSRSDMDAIKQAIHQVLAETHPATVRQTFYQLVSEAEERDTLRRIIRNLGRAA
jgi:hypothetical protein